MPQRPPVFRPAGATTSTAPPRRGKGANARGYTYRWQKESRLFLQLNPLCVECERQGRVTEATCVDHVVPHRGDQARFWDVSNWAPLCLHCHNAKSARGE
jgi:5-methylcytosine-specific restriction protein A